MRQLLFILVLIFCMSCKNKSTERYPYTFYSIKNYDGTAVEKLAQMVRKNDTVKILKFLADNPSVSIDTRDKYFGYSLLMWAIFNHKYEAFHCLLNHGANPNFIGYYRRETPLYLATSYCGPNYERDFRYCKELLEHGANPNFGDVIRNAVARDLVFTQLLIEYGADYNKQINQHSPAEWAIILCKPEIAEYLIIEKKGLLYNKPFYGSFSEDNSDFILFKRKIENYLKKHPEQLQLLHKNRSIYNE